MIKKAILLHGTGGSNKDYYWFADTKDYLEQHDYKVWWPALPDTNNPNLDETKKFVEANMNSVDDDTIIIAHSSACPLILHILESLEVHVKQVILVAGYYNNIEDEAGSMLPPNGFNWPEIKPKATQYIFINSDIDPWGCDDEQARDAARALEASLIVNFGEGHMGSDSFDQPYREFKLVKKLIDI